MSYKIVWIENRTDRYNSGESHEPMTFDEAIDVINRLIEKDTHNGKVTYTIVEVIEE